MKGRMLFRALRNIDEQLILDAAPGEWAKVRKRAALARWGAFAACFCILMVGVFFVYLQKSPYLPHPENTTPPGGTVTPPAPHVHAFGAWQVTKEATCSEMGEEMRVCACGEKEIQLIAMQEHFAGAWVIEKEPVIKVPTPEDPEAREPGLMCQFCHYCGAKLGEEVIPAIGSLGLAYAVNLDGKTCTVIGIGNCIDTEIIIPPNFCGYHVTDIADSAFAGNTDITSVTLPETLVTIGNYAFGGCTGLEEIVIPDSVVYIGDSAFEGCTNLADIVFSQSLSIIGMRAFYGCTSLTDITLPDSVMMIDDEAFAECVHLKNVTLSQSVMYIGSYAFANCSLLTEIAIPASVMMMGDKVFQNCDALTDFYITDLAAWCQIEAGTETKYYDYAPQRRIYLNGELLVNVEIPEGTESIASCAFLNCKDIVSITIPESVTALGSYAFYGCEGIVEIVIPKDVTYIGECILHECPRP